MNKYIICLIIILGMLVSCVGAVPVTGAVAGVTNNAATFTCAGASGSTWYQYGTNPNYLNFWTPKKTAVGGVSTVTQNGGPIYPSTTYYVSACDSTGCDATPETFTTLAVTPLAFNDMGTAITNMTENNFNMLYIPDNIMTPYKWLLPTNTAGRMTTIVFGVMMLFIYVGFWIRSRNVFIPALVGLLTAGFVLFPGTGLNLGIPTMFADIAQGLLYASLAGLLLSLLKK